MYNNMYKHVQRDTTERAMYNMHNATDTTTHHPSSMAASHISLSLSLSNQQHNQLT